MAALGSQSIASSYEQLLHVDRDGGGDTTNHVSVKDGDNETTFGFTIASDALMMTSTNRLEFGDTGTYIHQSADGVLDLVSDSEIEINATTIDMNGAIDLSGDLTLAGDIVFNAAGKGICLGVTSNTDSNTLDDYEEGVYTPTVTCATSGSFTTGSYTQLSYTKVGRLVTIGGYLQIDSESSPSGGIRLSLPFAASNLGSGADNNAGTFKLRDTGGTDSLLNTFILVRPNEAASELLAIDADGTKFAIDEGDVDTAWSCWVGLSYTAT